MEFSVLFEWRKDDMHEPPRPRATKQKDKLLGKITVHGGKLAFGTTNFTADKVKITILDRNVFSPCKKELVR